MVRNVEHLDLVKVRQQKQTSVALKKGNMSRDVFNMGDKVRLQDQKTKRWDQIGKLEEERLSDDGRKVSYVVQLESGNSTIRHKSHLRHFTSVNERAAEVKVRLKLSSTLMGPQQPCVTGARWAILDSAS